MDLLGGAEQTGTTDRILTAGAMNRGVGALIMPNLSEVGMPGLRGVPVLNLDAACCGLEPTDEVGHMVLTMEDDAAAGGLKLLLELACECALRTDESILDGFCSSGLTGLCTDPVPQ